MVRLPLQSPNPHCVGQPQQQNRQKGTRAPRRVETWSRPPDEDNEATSVRVRIRQSEVTQREASTFTLDLLPGILSLAASEFPWALFAEHSASWLDAFRQAALQPFASSEAPLLLLEAAELSHGASQTNANRISDSITCTQ